MGGWAVSPAACHPQVLGGPLCAVDLPASGRPSATMQTACSIKRPVTNGELPEGSASWACNARCTRRGWKQSNLKPSPACSDGMACASGAGDNLPVCAEGTRTLQPGIGKYHTPKEHDLSKK